jgi:hypothetical protein
VILVKAEDPRLHCTLQPGGQRSKVPCRFEVEEGTDVRLRVDRRGYRSFKKRWTVKVDRTLELELDQRAHRVQLAGTGGKQPVAKAAPPAPVPAKKPAMKRPPASDRKKPSKSGGGWDFP